MRFVLPLFLACLSAPALAANYPNDPPAFPTRNEKLREQLADDPDRILPRTDYFSAAIDADFFKPTYLESQSDANRTKYAANPYHGNGYWIETRMEFVPTEAARLNLKLVPWFGTSSSGYAASSGLHALAAASWDDRLFETDWRFRFRASDLGLQTYGGGLFVQDRPMNGGKVEFVRGDLVFGSTTDGTGGLAVPGELYDHHLGTTDGRFVGGVLVNPDSGPGGMALPPTPYLAARIGIGAGTFLLAEVAGNREGPAGRLATETRFESEKFRFFARPEVRYYDGGVAGLYRGNTQQVYTGYDLQSLSYTNAINVFRTSDAAFVSAARVSAEWRALRSVSLYLDQEAGRFDFRDAADEDFYFWDVGMRLYPALPRRDYATIGFTNKLLTTVHGFTTSSGAPGYSPVMPTDVDTEANKPRFVRQLQFVVTLHTSF